MSTIDNDELIAKRICFQCVGEPYLSAEIVRDGIVVPCSYCGKTEKSITVEALADRVESAFSEHYTRTDTEPDSWQLSLLRDPESTYDWFRAGTPVIDAIEDAAVIPSAAATDVQAILEDRYDDFEAAKLGEETEFSSESHYEEKAASAAAWQEEWRAFEESLKTEARFFSRSAAARLSAMFGAIDSLKTTDGSPLIVQAGPQLELDHLYRARVFQATDKLEEALCRPDTQLGSPSFALASAGRMNARGISVFYGATQAETAIAEVRPPVGGRVATAKFSVLRSLRLLDLTALENVKDGGSIFDPTLKNRLERVAFLRTLGQRMTRPVMPDDEALDYLPTQAIADFLATENEPPLDGIIFASVQVKDGRNVVLFHKAARVESMDLPKGATVSAQCTYETEEGPEIDYWVMEEVPPSPAPSAAPAPADLLPFIASAFDLDGDSRSAALHLEPTSVKVHHVRWIEYKCVTYNVRRHRFEKGASEF